LTNGKKGTSPWIWVGCGCVVLMGLVVLAVVGAGFWGFTTFKGYVDDIKDPAARAAEVEKILGADELPEGYYAHFFFRVPWIMEMAILSDRPVREMTEEELEGYDPLDSEEVGDHLFMYFSVRGDEKQEFESIFEDGGGKPGGMEFDLGSSFEPREKLGEGSFEIGPQKIRYVTHRGEMVTEDHRRLDGIFANMLIDCPPGGGDRTRFALWFAREPKPAAATAEAEPTPVEESPVETAPPEASTLELAGTPADEAALRDFMGHFSVCGG
jgi:hypothetical protein